MYPSLRHHSRTQPLIIISTQNPGYLYYVYEKTLADTPVIFPNFLTIAEANFVLTVCLSLMGLYFLKIFLLNSINLSNTSIWKSFYSLCVCHHIIILLFLIAYYTPSAWFSNHFNCPFYCPEIQIFQFIQLAVARNKFRAVNLPLKQLQILISWSLPVFQFLPLFTKAIVSIPPADSLVRWSFVPSRT